MNFAKQLASRIAPRYLFSSHLVKTTDLNPDANSATSKHQNKDFYSSVLDFDH